MARFDRRRTYPLFSEQDNSIEGRRTDDIVCRTKVLERKGGRLKIVGPADLTIKKALGMVKHPYLYKFAASRFTHGGASRFFGSRNCNVSLGDFSTDFSGDFLIFDPNE